MCLVPGLLPSMAGLLARPCLLAACLGGGEQGAAASQCWTNFLSSLQPAGAGSRASVAPAANGGSAETLMEASAQEQGVNSGGRQHDVAVHWLLA